MSEYNLKETGQATAAAATTLNSCLSLTDLPRTQFADTRARRTSNALRPPLYTCLIEGLLLSAPENPASYHTYLRVSVKLYIDVPGSSEYRRSRGQALYLLLAFSVSQTSTHSAMVAARSFGDLVDATALCIEKHGMYHVRHSIADD